MDRNEQGNDMFDTPINNWSQDPLSVSQRMKTLADMEREPEYVAPEVMTDAELLAMAVHDDDKQLRRRAALLLADRRYNEGWRDALAGVLERVGK